MQRMLHPSCPRSCMLCAYGVIAIYNGPFGAKRSVDWCACAPAEGAACEAAWALRCCQTVRDTPPRRLKLPFMLPEQAEAFARRRSELAGPQLGERMLRCWAAPSRPTQAGETACEACKRFFGTLAVACCNVASICVTVCSCFSASVCASCRSVGGTLGGRLEAAQLAANRLPAHDCGMGKRAVRGP